MGDDKNRSIESFVMDLKSIPLHEETGPLEIIKISSGDGFFINDSYSQDFRLRRPVYDKILGAKNHLPSGFFFCFYEAYRPLSRQIEMWESIQKELRQKFPDIEGDEFLHLCENFIANPYDGIGSGHQAACAVDVTLCDSSGAELDMGTKMHEFNDLTQTNSEEISEEQKKNRKILVSALHSVGFENYPAEWWHFSYGDHQWAWLAKEPQAIYGPIDM